MKKLLLIVIITSSQAKAQNVGIGTITPASKLTVSGNESTIAGLDAGIQITNTAPGGSTWYLRAGATGTETPPGGFSLTNASSYRFSMDNTGRLGLGISNPTEKLHLNIGNIKLGQSDKGIILNSADRAMITRGFDPFTSGVHTGLGRWGLFMEPNNLTLGIPNAFGKEVEVAKFNVDGTKIPVFSVSGEGLIKIFDDAGTEGQVLTSNGTNAASWQNAALTSSTRFSVNYVDNSNTALNFVTFNTTPRYNLDPTNISISSTGVTLSKAGLYRFEIFMECGANHSSPPIDIPFIITDLDVGQPTNYTIIKARLERSLNDHTVAATLFDYSTFVNFEVYVTAGAVIRIRKLLSSNTSNSRYITGHLTAHYIAP